MHGHPALARSQARNRIAIGAGLVLAFQDHDREWARRSFAGQALADAIDFVAIVSGRGAPVASRLVGGAMAAGSAPFGAAYARGPDV